MKLKFLFLLLLQSYLIVNAQHEDRYSRLLQSKFKIDSINTSKTWKLIKHNLYIANNGEIGFKYIEQTDVGIAFTMYFLSFRDQNQTLTSVIDTASFQYIGNHFYKDLNHIYLHHQGASGGYFMLLKEASLQSFILLGDCYGKDDKHIYSNKLGLIENVDYHSFKPLVDCYYQDKYHYYYNGNIIFKDDYLLFISYSNQNNNSKTKHKQALEITKIEDNFFVYTTYKKLADGTIFPSNSMYVVTKDDVILFDTPWDTTQFQPLLDSIYQRHQKKPVLCIATHFHDDRTAGLEYFKQNEIKTFTTAKTDSLSKLYQEKRAEFIISEDTTITHHDITFEIFYPGQGHTPDNIVIWFPKQKILYGGCFVKSVETKTLGNIEHANLKEWLKSEKKIMNWYPDIKHIIVGHFSYSSNNALRHTEKLLQKALKKQ